MLAYIRKMAVEQKQWLNDDDDDAFRAGVAHCQIIPGASAMQIGLRGSEGGRRLWSSCRLYRLRPAGILYDDASFCHIYADT